MRNKAIDITKGILVCFMIYAHCLQFFVDFEIHKGMHIVSETINLTAFSGFVFCFGFTSFWAYQQTDKNVSFKHMMKNVLRLLSAFYISSFFYIIYVEKIPLRADSVLDILLIRRLAGWSEFLLSFAVIMLLNIPLSYFKEKLSNGILVCLMLFSTISSLFQNWENPPILGTIWGGRGAPFFPCIPYCFYFFMGMYIAKNQIQVKSKMLLISILGTAFYYVSWFLEGQQPSRFPLSIQHLLGAALYIYVLYSVSVWLDNSFKKKMLLGKLESIGENSIFYLLFSNLVIFSLTKTAFYKRTPLYCVMLAIVLILMIYYFTKIIRTHTKSV